MAGDESGISKILEQAALAREMAVLEERRKRDAQPFVVPELVSTDAESYARCLAPDAALEKFGLSREIAIIQLQRELASARVQAVCHEAITSIEGETTRAGLAVLGAWVWQLTFPDATSDFWQTGYWLQSIPKTLSLYTSQGHLELFGVRFWPDGLPGGLDNPLPSHSACTAEAQPPLPPLPEAERERISQAILAIWGPSINETKAWQLAKGMCPENRVSREPFLEIFRAIRGHKSPGKQPSRGK